MGDLVIHLEVGILEHREVMNRTSRRAAKRGNVCLVFAVRLAMTPKRVNYATEGANWMSHLRDPSTALVRPTKKTFGYMRSSLFMP